MRKILNIYLFLLALLVGLEISAGAFVAPVIFYPDELIGKGILTHFQSGILMSEIFVRFNNALLFVSAVAFIYEAVNLAKSKNESFNLRFSTFMLAFINVMLAASFVFYFTDYILEAQKLGPEATIESESFAKMHSASEWVMKIMLFAQTILFFLRFPRKVEC